jgi:hypothetical protein
VKLVTLVEVGAHVVCDLVIRPGTASEVAPARRLRAGRDSHGLKRPFRRLTGHCIYNGP